MKKKFIISCIVAILLGTLLHFVYDISNNNFIVGLLTPVNESIWEHLKLIYLPILIFAIISKIFFKYKNIFISSAIATLLSSLLLLFIHYTLKKINTESIFIDITSYILSMFFAFYIMYIHVNNNLLQKYEPLGIILHIIFVIMFALLTIYPPHIQLFLDETTNSYGYFS